MNIKLKPIGLIKTDGPTVPRHWTLSEVTGKIVIDEAYSKGMKDIQEGQDKDGLTAEHGLSLHIFFNKKPIIFPA
jgi:hypothetical protein